MSVIQLVGCSAVLMSVIAAEVSVIRLLTACRIEATIARAAVLLGGLVWLAWPFWLTAAPPFEIRIHPLLGINGVLAPEPATGVKGANLGIWTEQPVAYVVMALGQDVPYRLPVSPWPGVGFDLSVAAGGAILMKLLDVWKWRGWIGWREAFADPHSH